ncbi:MAG TPA: HD domain-containing phosphohydrolase, partial [Anaerolineaceae bacterium]
ARSGLSLGGKRFSSLLAAPLVREGVLFGLILLADTAENTFRPVSLPIIEAASTRLMNAWEYAAQNETLTEFVQSISMMSVVQEMPSLLEMTASIARQALNASLVVAASLHQQDWLIRSSGRAPRLIQSLQKNAAPFLELAAKSPYTFRLQDVRTDERTSRIQIDSADLCTLLASPIRISGAATGVLLAFGKVNAKQFSDTDVFLTELLASQTAVNLESCYLNHELRTNLKTTQLLYDLSLSISKAENLQDAARAIARTAYRLLQARKCGLMLFSADGRTEAEVHFPSDDPAIHHPSALIQQAMDSRQTIYLAEAESLSQIAIPIQTMRRCYGALWMEISDDNEESRHPTEEIRILVNQAAVALERSILLEETRYQASEITRSYHRLEAAYEDLLYGLTKALDARDGETERHSLRVEDLSVRLGMEMGLTRSELQALKRGALLHDIGKIGVPDSILRKCGPLDEEEWTEMRQHPQKGAQIIQEIPALHDALPVIAFHQERWDGSGYPLHLHGVDIPLLARIFSVVDVFDALTSDRPYRKAVSMEQALAYLEENSGQKFDPDVVSTFVHLVRSMRSDAPGSEQAAG